MVRCIQCGYLALRRRDNRQLIETDAIFRETGRPTIEDCLQVTLPAPCCFVQAHPIHQEKDSKHSDLTAKAIMNRERECESFIPWRQGFSPQEHQAMLEQRQLLEWQRKVEQEDREWREHQRQEDNARWEQQRQEDLKWKERQEKATKNQFLLQLVIVGGVATFIMAASQLIGSWMQAQATRSASNPLPPLVQQPQPVQPSPP